jgi:hypothetical protein
MNTLRYASPAMQPTEPTRKLPAPKRFPGNSQATDAAGLRLAGSQASGASPGLANLVASSLALKDACLTGDITVGDSLALVGSQMTGQAQADRAIALDHSAVNGRLVANRTIMLRDSVVGKLPGAEGDKGRRHQKASPFAITTTSPKQTDPVTLLLTHNSHVYGDLKLPPGSRVLKDATSQVHGRLHGASVQVIVPAPVQAQAADASPVTFSAIG